MILQASPDAPALLHVAAATLLYAHIAGGAIALLAGPVALFAPKGGRLHRRAGTVFVGAMLVMSAIGAMVSPFLEAPFDAAAGAFTFYLVITAWLTVRRPPGQGGRPERWACAGVLALLAATLGAAALAAQHPFGRLGGYPPAAYGVLSSLLALAAWGDLRLLARGVAGRRRIARHVWRMGLALFVANASFFLGQQRQFPEAWRGAPVWYLPEIVVLGAMAYWLLRTALAGRGRPHTVAPAGALR